MRPRPRPPEGCAVVAPGVYVWENTGVDLAWAHELAAFARALRRTRRG